MADYLPECAASVLGQTLPETELILVDDGSTDGSERLADAWQAAQPERVKVIHQPNRGPSAARNAGLDAAEGRCVHFLDSDDRLKPEALERLEREATEKELDILFICAQVFSDDPGLQGDVREHRDEFIRTAGTGRVLSGRESLRELYALRREEYPAPVWTRLYRREYLLRTGIRYPEGVIHEDEDFGFLTYLMAERMEQIPDVLLERRLRRGSIMYTKRLIDSVKGYQNAFGKIMDLYEAAPSGEDRQLLIAHSERLIFYTRCSTSRQGPRPARPAAR